jgi:hypothetical protein
MKTKKTLKQIHQLMTAVVGLGLSNDQNFPSESGNPRGEYEISVNNAVSLSLALRNVPYDEIYHELDRGRAFNLKMLDGALVTLRYRFRRGVICEHSLTYFPSPDLAEFQNDPELYLMDEIYADVVARNIVPFPIRFDFNSDETRFVEIHHPYSHLTLGQYEHCRIPVSSPLTPLTFGTFILRSFYNTAYRKYSDRIPCGVQLFPNTITANEKRVPHVALVS